MRCGISAVTSSAWPFSECAAIGASIERHNQNARHFRLRKRDVKGSQQTTEDDNARRSQSHSSGRPQPRHRPDHAHDRAGRRLPSQIHQRIRRRTQTRWHGRNPPLPKTSPGHMAHRQVARHPQRTSSPSATPSGSATSNLLTPKSTPLRVTPCRTATTCPGKASGKEGKDNDRGRVRRQHRTTRQSHLSSFCNPAPCPQSPKPGSFCKPTVTSEKQ